MFKINFIYLLFYFTVFVNASPTNSQPGIDKNPTNSQSVTDIVYNANAGLSNTDLKDLKSIPVIINEPLSKNDKTDIEICENISTVTNNHNEILSDLNKEGGEYNDNSV